MECKEFIRKQIVKIKAFRLGFDPVPDWFSASSIVKLIPTGVTIRNQKNEEVEVEIGNILFDGISMWSETKEKFRQDYMEYPSDDQIKKIIG